MGEVIIPGEVVAKYAKAAREMRRTDTTFRNSLHRFNTGLTLLDGNGNPTEESYNGTDFFPAETNAAGIAALAENLPGAIAATTDPRTRRTLLDMQAKQPYMKAIPLERPPYIGNETSDHVWHIAETEERVNPLDPDGKQMIRFVRYNWTEENAGKPVVTLLPSYNTSSDNGSTAQVRHETLAKIMPDTPMIAFMHPGAGSDPLTPAQIKELKGPESYFSIADAYLAILEDMKVDAIHIVGQSKGGYAGLAMGVRAIKAGISVDKMVLANLKGIKRMFPIYLAAKLGQSGKYRRAEWSGIFDPAIHEAGNLHLSEKEFKQKDLKWGKSLLTNDPWQHGFPYGRAMSKDVATDRLRTIMKDSTSSVVIVCGSEDGVSPTKAVNKIVHTLRDEGYGSDRVGRIIYSGGSHAVMENPWRFAGVVKHVLTTNSAPSR